MHSSPAALPLPVVVSGHEVSMSPPPSRPSRIVVTDDDPTLMAFLVTTLRDAGHCVFAAYDADSACELALLITDVDLLITNSRFGTETSRRLIKRVRTEKSELPILHVGERLPNPDGLLDDVPHLPEPFTADQLLAQVRELIVERSERI